MSFDQIGVALFGVTAVALSQMGPKWHRYACIFGLLSQPFWFYATWTAGQWGIFALCFLYTFAWLNGFYRYWVKPALDSRVSKLQRTHR